MVRDVLAVVPNERRDEVDRLHQQLVDLSELAPQRLLLYGARSEIR